MFHAVDGRSGRKKVLAAIGSIIVVIGLVAIWKLQPLPAMPSGIAAMESDGAVQVDSTRWLTFQPRGSNPKTGFIVYPGGLVDPRAYAPESRAIAARGYLVVIVPMPLNFAIIAPDRAADVIAAYPAVQAWAIGGHSLGGVAAARFIHYHPGAVRGLVLWASYPDVSA